MKKMEGEEEFIRLSFRLPFKINQSYGFQEVTHVLSVVNVNDHVINLLVLELM